MRQLEEAIAALTTSGLTLPNALSEPLQVLIKEAVRFRSALRWYANEANYIDGALLGIDVSGLQSLPDNGLRARMALRLIDLSYPLLLVNLEREEIARYEALLNRLVPLPVVPEGGQ